MRFSTSGSSKGQHVLPSVHEGAIQQHARLPGDLCRQPLHVEPSQALLDRQVRISQPMLDPVCPSHLTLLFGKLPKVLLVAERVLDRAAGQVLEAITKRGQVKLSQAL